MSLEMSDEQYQLHIKRISNAYQVIQNIIDERSKKVPINEDGLKISQQQLIYLSNTINSLVDKRATNTNTDTKPARLIPVRLI